MLNLLLALRCLIDGALACSLLPCTSLAGAQSPELTREQEKRAREEGKPGPTLLTPCSQHLAPAQTHTHQCAQIHFLSLHFFLSLSPVLFFLSLSRSFSLLSLSSASPFYYLHLKLYPFESLSISVLPFSLLLPLQLSISLSFLDSPPPAPPMQVGAHTLSFIPYFLLYIFYVQIC